ncbi:MAG TPA: hypothetical protein VLL54_18325 [Pyrinomonadaceae bacterium]|nr:hypothetical protein [Pyrinomonadaceae bacterium]
MARLNRFRALSIRNQRNAARRPFSVWISDRLVVNFDYAASVGAGGGAGIDELVGPEIRMWFERHYISGGGHLVIGQAVESPFIPGKKKTRQLIAQSGQNSFAVRSCFSLATRDKTFSVWRPVNTAFSKVFHAILYGIHCAKVNKTTLSTVAVWQVNEVVSLVLEISHQ